MAREGFHVPLVCTLQHGSLVWRIELAIEVESRPGVFVPIPFLFDTGTAFTTIPIVQAQQLSIPYVTTKPVFIRGTTGAGLGYFSPVTFSFPSLPQWRFETQGCFTPHPLRRALLSLSDILTHFTINTTRPSATFPHGSIHLRLRRDHKATPRP